MIPAETALLTAFFAKLWNTYLSPIETTEAGYGIQVMIGAKRKQGLQLLYVLFLVFHGFQTLGKADIAYKPFFAFAHDGSDGLLDDVILQKNAG